MVLVEMLLLVVAKTNSFLQSLGSMSSINIANVISHEQKNVKTNLPSLSFVDKVYFVFSFSLALTF